MLRSLGLNNSELYGHLKEKPSPLLGGKTPRHAMQTLGTEWGRNLISADLWTNAWLVPVQEHLANGRCVVVDDVRFKNEMQIIHGLGGELWCVDRKILKPIVTHVSEEGPQVLTASFPYSYLLNYEGLDRIEEAVDTLLKEVQVSE
jgi:hypothetical protein